MNSITSRRFKQRWGLFEKPAGGLFRRVVVTIGGVQFDLKVTFLIVLATVVPMLDFYGHKFTNTKALDRFVWYFIIPMLVILLLFRESPAEYGFKLGKWQTGQRKSVV